MRLQISIQRHALPAVQIIFTTGTGPASHTKSCRHATIADLLHDVNDLLPLESADGEWGLEDYVVDVAATADQVTSYECLHFQTIESVLRDDDEVVIRAMSTEELKMRRLGGRHQITGDGRHLIDGVSFGKRWLRVGARPGVVIPPRKRRRLDIAEEGAGDEETVVMLPQIEGREYDGETQRALVTIPEEDDEDDEDDEDYEDEEDDEMEEDGEVALREVFDNADVSSADEEDEEDERDGDEADDLMQLVRAVDSPPAPPAEVLEVLLRSAASAKRKRDLEDDGDDPAEEDGFSGFSTPAKSPRPRNGPDLSEGGVGSEDDSDSAVNFDSQTSSSDTDADSVMEDIVPIKAQKKKTKIIRTDEKVDTLDSDVTSSSSTSEFDSGDDHDSSSNSAEEEGDTTSSSGSDSDSGSGSSSGSSSGSESEMDGSPKKTAALKAVTRSAQKEVAQPNKHVSSQPKQIVQSAPGQGLSKTQSNNRRVKLRKRLQLLKREGLLPENANFEDLRIYEDSHATEPVEPTEPDLEVEAARQKLLAEVQDHSTLAEPSLAEAIQDIDQVSSLREASLQDAAPDLEVDDTSPPTFKQQAAPATTEPPAETPTRRARLDLASSRRMLFGSLGLKTPTTPAAEEALREKLSQSIRMPPMVKSDAARNETTQVEEPAEDLWKGKLVLSAVECERDGVVMQPPPFPFEQRWSKAKRKTRSQESQFSYDDPVSRVHDGSDQSQTGKFAPDTSTSALQEGHDEAHRNGDNESRTISLGNADLDDIHVPREFGLLKDLQESDLLQGSIIAYKELHVNAETNFQPEVSQYRVGRVTSTSNDGSLSVILSRKDRKGSIRHDPETGERIYSKFELQGSEDEDGVDDGIREFDFAAMIQPKLVRASTVQVPESNLSIEVSGGDAAAVSEQGNATFIPESALSDTHEEYPVPSQISFQQIEVNIPRKNDITTVVNESESDSVLDQQLLHQLSVPDDNQLPPSSQPGQAETPQVSESKEDSAPYPQDKYIGSLQANGWSSTPLPHRPEMQLNGDILATSLDPPYSPPGSPQVSVDYPHLPQMEPDSLGPVPNNSNKSSSHQDAQRLSPGPQADLTFTVSEEREETVLRNEKEEFDIDEPLKSMQPEIPGSQSQEARGTELQLEDRNDRDSSPQPNSFLGAHGYDGQESSYHHSHDEARQPCDSESSLPSVREFTSSQVQRKIAKASSQPKKVTPSKLTKKFLRGTKQRKLSTPPSSPDSASKLPPSSQPSIKISQSQQAMDSRSLSQIPTGTKIVDLTGSSDPASPGGSDGEHQSGSRRSLRSSQNSQANGNSKGMVESKAASASPNGQGLGIRRLLTTKKTRSQT